MLKMTDGKTREYKTGSIDEEEMLVYVKFENETDDYSMEDLKNYKLIGLESKEPVLKLGTKLFAGQWKNSATTAAFFGDDTNSNQEESCFTKHIKQPLKFVDETRKTLRMTRIFVSSERD